MNDKTPSNEEKLLLSARKIFFMFLLMQAMLSLIVFSGYMFYSNKDHQLNTAHTVQAEFKAWEQEISDIVYINEVVNQTNKIDEEIFNYFAENLNLAGINAAVGLAACEAEHNFLFPLSMGTKMLDSCFFVDIKNNEVQKSLAVFTMVLLASLLLTLCLWFLMARSLRVKIYQPLLESIKQQSRELGGLLIARQVAHDIRAPLSALTIISANATELQTNKKSLLLNAVTRIKNITNDLDSLNQDRSTANVGSFRIFKLLNEILNEKQHIFKHINLDFKIKPSRLKLESLVVSGSRTEMGRVFSNIITNAVEASGKNTKVEIFMLLRNSNEIMVTVKDSGSGVDSSVMDQMGVSPISIGKKRGSGLGLFHAFQTVKKLGGNIEVETKAGQGTRVNILLPVKHVLKQETTTHLNAQASDCTS